MKSDILREQGHIDELMSIKDPEKIKILITQMLIEEGLNAFLLNEAIELAETVHRGQLRVEGTPYVIHPLRIVYHLLLDGIFDEEILIIAVLHDTIEDSDLGQAAGEIKKDLVVKLPNLSVL